MIAFRVQKKVGTRPDWSPLGVYFKISNEHPRPFHIGEPPGAGQERGLRQRVRQKSNSSGGSTNQTLIWRLEDTVQTLESPRLLHLCCTVHLGPGSARWGKNEKKRVVESGRWSRVPSWLGRWKGITPYPPLLRLPLHSARFNSGAEKY